MITQADRDAMWESATEARDKLYDAAFESAWDAMREQVWASPH